MSKKNLILIGVAVVVIAVLIYLLVGSKNSQDNSAGETPAATNNSAEEVPAVPSSPTAYNPRSDSIRQDSQTLKVTANDFAPKELNALVNSKITLTLSATDEATHKIVFTDQVLSYINLTFSKIGGDKTITFPAPSAGEYSFYVDDKDNVGKLTVR